MRFFNGNIESSVGVSSIYQGEYVGLGYTTYQPPTNGLIIQGNVGVGTYLPTQLLDINGSTRYRGAFYDVNNSAGSAGQVLSSTVTGVAWTTAGSGGGGNISGAISAGQIPFGYGANLLTGVSTFVYYQGKLGLGTAFPTDVLQVVNSFNTSLLYVSAGAGFVGIFTNTPTFYPPETLSIRQYANGYYSVSTSFTLISGISSVNSYSQVIIYNLNPGNAASVDFVAQADIGSDNSGYIDFGINNSGYNQNGLYGAALDSYLYSLSNNLWIGNVSTSLYGLYFVTGGGIFTQQTRMTITGFGSIGIGTIYPTQLLDINGATRHRGAIYDVNNFVGSLGQVLSSTGTGISWTSITAGSGSIVGSIVLNQVAYGSGTNAIQGSNNLFFTGSQLGVGTSSMISRLVVQSQDISSSVFRVQGLSGTLLETFDSLTGTLEQISNISGLPIFQVNDGVTAPNAIVYSGGVGQTIAILSIQTSGSVISSFSTSVAYFSQKVGINSLLPTQSLDVNGTVILRGILYDSNSSPGLAGSVLASIGTGVIWVPQTGGGNANITISAPQIPFASTTNTLIGVSTFVYYQGNLGIGTIYPTQNLDVANGARFRGTVYDLNNVPGQSGQILQSTGAGITWTNATGGGNISGTLAPGQVVYGSGINSVTSTAAIIANGSGIGVNTNFVNTPLAIFSNLSSFSSTQWYNQVAYPVIYSNNTINTLPASNSVFGLWILNNDFLGSTSGNAVRGIQAQNYINQSTNTQHVGVLGYNYFRHTSGINTGNTYAIWGLNQFSASGGVTSSAIEIYSSSLFSLGHILGNRYGVFVDNPNTAGNGLCTNNYGIFVTQQTGGQLNFAIYSAGGFNYFGGSVGLNTIIPTQPLDVNGSTRLRGALYDRNYNAGQNLGIVTQYLASYNGVGVTWAPIKRSIITELMTGYTVSTAGIDPGIFIFPYDPNDGVSVMNFTFKRVIARCETTSATGITTINIAKSIGTGQFFGTSILTNNILISGIYEGFSTSFGISTAQSGDKIAVNFVGTAPTFANWTIAIIARET